MYELHDLDWNLTRQRFLLVRLFIGFVQLGTFEIQAQTLPCGKLDKATLSFVSRNVGCLVRCFIGESETIQAEPVLRLG